MNAATMNGATVMNNTEKKAGLFERFQNYMLENAESFAAASAMMSGQGCASAQIMLNARCVKENNR